MAERKTWGIGSEGYRKTPGRAEGTDQDSSSRGDGIGSSGRVQWDRSQLDFTLIPTSTRDRALFRFEKTLDRFIWNAAAL